MLTVTVNSSPGFTAEAEASTAKVRLSTVPAAEAVRITEKHTLTTRSISTMIF